MRPSHCAAPRSALRCAGRERTNPGLLANRSGAELLLRLDTLSSAEGAAEEAAGATQPVLRLGDIPRCIDATQRRPTAHSSATCGQVIQVEYLASYEHMGTLRVECVGGCECRPALVDAHTDERASRHRLGCLPVSAARECDVRLAVTAASRSGGHKFVLHALRVLRAPPAKHGAREAAAGAPLDSCDGLPQRTYKYALS
jgi:hypothetical protein